MKCKFLKAAFTGLCLLTSSVTSATLMSSYDFNGDLTDSLGVGASLTSKGGVLDNGRYAFTNGQGLALDIYSLFNPVDSYAIEMKFKTDDGFSGYNRLIDWSDLNSDLGLYIHNNQINMYNYGSTPNSTVPAGEDFTLGFEFNAVTNTISYYINGGFIGSRVDTSHIANLDSSAVSFFDDNTSHGTTEEFTGSVDFIRFHHDASTFGQLPQINSVPEPTTLAILGLGVLGFVSRRFKKTS